ncbi:bacillithiol biosynthesis cysteine-adding enzyme BshC [Gaetbulibacter sp. M240]|uniref:bacillithiol biosynthesis cysteine-adding enzyme BshC n=1 Tax=Gaetbulibacter sp. M240 TaxID=3126511 RepID=UPI00374FAA1B
MQTEYISFEKTGYFSSLITDYLNKDPKLNPFYNRYPDLDAFQDQIKDKTKSFSNDNRSVLVKALKDQYANLEVSEETINNIEALKVSNTLTVTTGHQLNLFTGPLYFLYKIVSTINLSKVLQDKYPENQFVPVYWMATEDHDFDEINFFNFEGKKIQWSKDSKGAVGELNTTGLDEVFRIVSKAFGDSFVAQDLKKLFESAYLKHDNLADATRYLANALFKDLGLVIIDANDQDLKRLFIPYLQEELLERTSYQKVMETNAGLEKHYGLQVNPREINLFYLLEGLRERIVYNNAVYKVLNTDIIWSEEALLKELEQHPERFSPNVIMRPLYQEVILPNLCYIGGGGELAYWLQLKGFFEHVKIPYPILLLRNSVLIQTKKQKEKLEKLNVTTEALFQDQEELINKKVEELSEIDIDFSPQKEYLKEQFKDLYKLAEQTDKSFIGAVKAQEVKQINGLKNLEKRLLRAQKRKLSDEVERLTKLQNALFPNKGLQERNTNFSEFYLVYGDTLIPNLLDTLDPLSGEFLILTL